MQKTPLGGSSVELRGVTARYGDVVAVDDVSLDISAGSFLALLGPSGSGKTTILMTIAGFEQPARGRVTIGGVQGQARSRSP